MKFLFQCVCNIVYCLLVHGAPKWEVGHFMNIGLGLVAIVLHGHDANVLSQSQRQCIDATPCVFERVWDHLVVDGSENFNKVGHPSS
ncbi:hypothetical protein SLA2020_006870 [Shorea laevis]